MLAGALQNTRDAPCSTPSHDLLSTPGLSRHTFFLLNRLRLSIFVLLVNLPSSMHSVLWAKSGLILASNSRAQYPLRPPYQRLPLPLPPRLTLQGSSFSLRHVTAFLASTFPSLFELHADAPRPTTLQSRLTTGAPGTKLPHLKTKQATG